MYEAANIIVDNATNPQIATQLIARFEVALLNELGFGLNLDKCVVSGVKHETDMGITQIGLRSEQKRR